MNRRQVWRVGCIAAVIAAGIGAATLAASPSRQPVQDWAPQAFGDPGEAGEKLAANQQLARLSAAPATVRPGAYAAALRQRAAIAAAGTRLSAATGKWAPYGRGPMVGSDSRFSRIANTGMPGLAGRVNHFAYDAKSGRLFASVGQGGVWMLERGSTTWRSIGDKLPTQAIGGLAFSPARGGTLLVTTGNDVFGGGTTFTGVGAYRSYDLGRTWRKSRGIPSGVNSFQVAVDPSNPNVVYAATGAGLFRSTNAGETYQNVRLPVSPAGAVPNCTGALPSVEGCYLANMVTDVVVRAPGGIGADKTGGAVVAAVGWRAGNKANTSKSYASYVESPGNGIYTSPTGVPGSFQKIDQASFTGDTTPIGRIELGATVGPAQDHDYLYAVVQDATPFQGGSDVAGIDAPGLVSGQPAKVTTYLKGIYSSRDFGRTWTFMAGPTQLAGPGTGSSLIGLACDDPRQTYCPGIQAWYNAWIEPDPTRADASGVPTRLVFGLEEVWQNSLADQGVAASGPTDFHVIASYTGGTACFNLILSFPACPTASGYGSTTLHPDHHDGLFVPDGNGGVTLYDGSDGGVGVQHVAAGQPLANSAWGNGLNDGFNTLMPYSAVMAKDGRAWAGLQDNGELRSDPSGEQFNTHDGDGTSSAVDPDDSNTVFERQPGGGLQLSTDGGQTWTAVTKPADTFQFVNPFSMDPLAADHLLDAGNLVWETADGGSNWTQVFSLGASATGVPYAMSAIDVRSQRYGPPLPTGPHTADFDYTDGGSTTPSGVTGGPADIPGTYADHAFTIGPDDGDARVQVKVEWDDATNDWDLFLYRQDGGSLVLVKSSTSFNPQTGIASESVSVPDPAAGDYVVRVVNATATGTFDAAATFTQRTDPIPSLLRDNAYVAFCGTCDALNARPFDNGIATNVGGSEPGEALTPKGWHRAAAAGLPKRFITSIASDPADPKTVYVTLAGYSRRWLTPGLLGEQPDLSKGNVFKSTDAGETFTNISGNLPDGPAESTLVYKGKLIVGTDTGVYISGGTNGQRYELLGNGLPNVPVFSIALKPKASPSEPDTLYVATHGRGIYTYRFPSR
ncbi:MAG TPA: hypothetical protein VJT84_04225 [Gaiellaceae bacterium]|nr:hypothetical protein [Gaiellaceae bacterium]